MTSRKRLILGILSFLPLLSLLTILIAAYFYTNPGDTYYTPVVLPAIIPFIILPLATGLVSIALGLVFYYIYHLGKASNLSMALKVVWVLFLACMGFVALPAYWLAYIRTS